MAQLHNMSTGALPEDPNKKIDSLVSHINKQNEIISNEDRTKIIKSDSGIETLTLGILPTGGNGLLVKDSDNVNRALFGEYPNGDIALKLSKPGEDVTTATDDELIFSSDYNSFKILSTGDVIIPAKTISGGTVNGIESVSVAHNLGFIPICMAFSTDSYNNRQTALPTFMVYQGGQLVSTGGPTTWIFPGNQYVNAQTSTTDVTFYNSFANSNSPSAYTSSPVYIKYYLLQETAG